MESHLAIIPRSSTEERTFAIVRWKGEVEKPDILNTLIEVVSEWINTTREGKQLWKDTHEDLNVGDLSSQMGNSELIVLLNKHGVYDLDIDTFVDYHPPFGWHYDTILAENITPDDD
jgi:hypothetical protein